MLIDTGTRIDGYSSDITRTYVFGEATPEVRRVWEAEKRAQAAAFEAAQPGVSCEAVDAAARRSLETDGFGPGYTLPSVAGGHKEPDLGGSVLLVHVAYLSIMGFVGLAITGRRLDRLLLK